MIRNKIVRVASIGVLVLGAFTLFIFGLTYVTMSLWNWLVPALFAGPSISFWQTMGLLVLLKILLWPLSGGRGWKSHRGGPGRYWAARWNSMTPDEKERLKARMREKWCAPRPAENTSTQDQAAGV